MKDIIRSRAYDLGFEACRFTTALPPEGASRFQDWLAAGCHGEMGYLERNAFKRIEPDQILAGARTIICLAASYAGSDGSPGRPGPRPEEWDRSSSRSSRCAGVIARYACFDDYHDVLAAKLRRLTDLVDEMAGPSHRTLWYVDTGPLLERDLGQRAGLGFIGKHTNLISRQLGNWFFLAEIITSLVLDPDSPERNRCGNCARCITACPTQAITAPFRLDARRCISYLTIELKGSIPVALRPAIGNRIYGCDDCLAVCPWNRFAQEGRIMREKARPDLALPDLLELLELDGQGFKKRFSATPMLRTKRRGLLRNVCVALGNIGDRSVLPALERAATDPEPLIAEHAQWAREEILRRNPTGPIGSPSPEPGF